MQTQKGETMEKEEITLSIQQIRNSIDSIYLSDGENIHIRDALNQIASLIENILLGDGE